MPGGATSSPEFGFETLFCRGMVSLHTGLSLPAQFGDIATAGEAINTWDPSVETGPAPSARARQGQCSLTDGGNGDNNHPGILRLTDPHCFPGGAAARLAAAFTLMKASLYDYMKSPTIPLDDST